MRADVGPSRGLVCPSPVTTSEATKPSTTSAVKSRSRTAPSSGTMCSRTAHEYWSSVPVWTRPSFDGSHDPARYSASVSSSEPTRPSAAAFRCATASRW